MKSIQTKFIALTLGFVLITAVVIGGAGVINSQRAADSASAQIMNLRCSEKAKELDGQLARIKQSVETLARYTLDQLESVTRLQTDPEYLEQYTQRLESVAVNAANNTEGAVAVYVRFNPNFWSPTSGLFWSKTDLNGIFQRQTPTDFSNYSPEDVEHVGWYYIPIRKGNATWMAPYFNQNINVRMISYVVPLYRNNITVGVVGMDIDFNVITDSVADMRLYETGYAFLTDREANIMYHKELPSGVNMENADKSLFPVVRELDYGTSGSSLFSYQWKGLPKKMAFRSLVNGMRLAVIAPESEIDAEKDRLIFHIIIAGLCISIFSVIMTTQLTKRIIRPLRELTEAAKRIAAGDLSVSLSPQTKDEIGTLADSFQQTVSHLQNYIDYINGLAYRDSMTGVKNKTAYDDMVKKLEEQMRMGRPEFAVVVFDINDLKLVNDRYGHDFGDMLIIDCCKIICSSFKHSPIYRIGGDEFVAILQDGDLEHYQGLMEGFEASIRKHNQNSRHESKIAIARGIAVYNSAIDLVFANLFKRADDAMYQNKISMKQHKEAREEANRMS